MTKSRYDRIEAYMLELMSDSAHDCGHVYRVLYTALSIAQAHAEVDTDVLIAACLLHDIGRDAQLRDKSLCHARVGAEMAYHFLIREGWEEHAAAHARDCIRTHRFRGDDEPSSIEAKILFDADKLDVAGAMGIARTLVYTGTVGRAIYAPEDIEGGTPAHGKRTNSFFGEYRYKLANLYDRFYTREALEAALQRRQAAVHFYDSLRAEIELPAVEGNRLLAGILRPDAQNR